MKISSVMFGEVLECLADKKIILENIKIIFFIFYFKIY
jgi:hypothetical protein